MTHADGFIGCKSCNASASKIATECLEFLNILLKINIRHQHNNPDGEFCIECYIYVWICF